MALSQIESQNEMQFGVIGSVPRCRTLCSPVSSPLLLGAGEIPRSESIWNGGGMGGLPAGVSCFRVGLPAVMMVSLIDCSYSSDSGDIFLCQPLKVKEALSVMPMDREFQNKMKDVEVEIWKSLEKTGCSVTSLLETYLRVKEKI